jgi:hypothetical protein
MFLNGPLQATVGATDGTCLAAGNPFQTPVKGRLRMGELACGCNAPPEVVVRPWSPTLKNA